MRFEDSLWDDTDPDYAPCMRKIRDNYIIWRPPALYLKSGYAVKQIRLEGHVGDGNDRQRAQQCRALTREMVEWHEGITNGRREGTWGWLISRYLSDEYSDLRNVQPTTRSQYVKVLRKIDDAIGEVYLSDTDYPRLMQWQITMRGKGRSVSYIKKWFTHWGLALSHGVKLGNEDCQRIKAIRAEMRIQSPAPRSVTINRGQIDLVIKEADRRGMPHLSLSLLFRFEFMLRGVDVSGEWEPSEGREGGVQHNGRLWVKGLTWEMFDKNLSKFTKVISKTAKSLPEPYTFDLTNVPDIRERLMAIPKEKRVGPVIVLPNGRPPRDTVLTRAFKVIVRESGLPENLRLSDSRSGGITEAKAMVDPYTLRDAAQHTQSSTTDRYVRNRSDAANKVVKMRGKRH